MSKNQHKVIFLVSAFVMGSLWWFAPTARGESLTQNEIGITFKESADKTKESLPRDNTLTAEKGTAISQTTALPQTGEVVKQLALFLVGMMMITLVFAVLLERQMKEDQE